MRERVVAMPEGVLGDFWVPFVTGSLSLMCAGASFTHEGVAAARSHGQSHVQFEHATDAEHVHEHGSRLDRDRR